MPTDKDLESLFGGDGFPHKHFDILSCILAACAARDLVLWIAGMTEDRWLSVDDITEYLDVVRRPSTDG